MSGRDWCSSMGSSSNTTLVCARCNFLLSELAGQPTMRVAQEIQELIKELRESSRVLKFFRIPEVNHWVWVINHI